MNYKVFIPTAGKGSRLQGATRHLNKSLVAVDHQPVLSHILSRVPAEVEIVIALGHKGALVREYLTVAHPQRRFTFVEVSPFEGEGSGLGYTLLACEAALQCPFVFWSCDTLFTGAKLPAPDGNWIGTGVRDDLSAYRTVSSKTAWVSGLHEKGAAPAKAEAYIGLAGIYDYAEFWRAMRAAPQVIAEGEAAGLRGLLKNSRIEAIRFNWLDTGTPQELENTRRALQSGTNYNILEKESESIWFVGDQVVKFAVDETFIRNRAARSRNLAGFVPEVTAVGRNLYAYRRAEGEVLSKVVDAALFRDLLKHLERFWAIRKLDARETVEFKQRGLAFYRAKTEERIGAYLKRYAQADTSEMVNGEVIPPVSSLLAQIDWASLADGLPGRFHGDLHFENILHDARSGRFHLLDWRQDFAGSLEYGDIYYDLAKLQHGLIMCHELVARDEFSFKRDEKSVRFDFLRKHRLVECETVLKDFVRAKGWSEQKVDLLTSLVFLNIAPLHHDPYSQVLFYLGKTGLYRQLAQAMGVEATG